MPPTYCSAAGRRVVPSECQTLPPCQPGCEMQPVVAARTKPAQYAEEAVVRKTEEPALEVGKKRCATCKKWLPATTDVFHRHPKGSYGLQSTCKQCRRNADRNKKLDLAKKKHTKTLPTDTQTEKESPEPEATNKTRTPEKVVAELNRLFERRRDIGQEIRTLVQELAEMEG